MRRKLECVLVPCKRKSVVIGRTNDLAFLKKFFAEYVEVEQNAALYLSGNPGTGKTFMVQSLLYSLPNRIKLVQLNCMKFHPKDILSILFCKLKISSFAELARSPEFILLVLDEIDHLLEKDLYALFELAMLPNSRVALIGIANQIDLITRLLPRLVAKQIAPQILNVCPYSTSEIVDIITQNKGGGNAVELCARKAAACGDLRKAIEIFEKSNQLAKKENIDNIQLPHVIKALEYLYQSPNLNTLNLHQQIILKSIQLEHKKSLGLVNDRYLDLCKEFKVKACGRSEFFDLVNGLEMSGILTLDKAKDERSRKLSLNVNSDEVSRWLQTISLFKL